MSLLTCSRQTLGSAAIALAIFGFATTTRGAAEPQPPAQQELDWARAALERNDALEVVASDPATGWITVRVKSTGQMRRVFAGSVVATLPEGGPAASSPEASSSAATSSPSDSEAAAVPAAPKDGHVLLSGPGYSIAATNGSTSGALASQPGASAAAGGATLAGGLPVEHLHEPIICQGSRLLHIDSRNIEFDGDAFSVQNRCELHITNSRIVAGGVGIEARDASVHIENSAIEGAVGSIEASDGAQVYASSSTFKGLIRRLDTAAFHDMGGNVGD